MESGGEVVEQKTVVSNAEEVFKWTNQVWNQNQYTERDREKSEFKWLLTQVEENLEFPAWKAMLFKKDFLDMT